MTFGLSICKQTTRTMKSNDLIFIVEDDEFYASTLECFLNSLGFTNIECYSNGLDSLKNCYKMPQLVLLDYNLSDINGVSVLLEFISFNSNTPIVFISAQASVQNAIETLKNGCFDYIQKDDMTYHKLRDVIDRITNGKKEIHKHVVKSRLKKIGFSLLAVSMLTITILDKFIV